MTLFALGVAAMVIGQSSVIPPVMSKRAISPPAHLPGKSIDLYGDGKYTLFIPDSWQPVDRPAITVHFHGAAWFAIEEHLRRGLKEPLLGIYLGEGSSVYQKPFEDPERWPVLLSHVIAELGGKSISRVDMTSFSAGYGAVRELLKQPGPIAIIHRLVLADSMYASFTSDGDHTPLSAQINPYVEFAKLAIEGKKEFVVTCSQVTTETYANSAACAEELVKKLGGRLMLADPTLPPTRGKDFPLLSRFDSVGFHVWAYGGTDAMAHMTHPRHIADIWRALDEKRS
ncbi:MAG TPA: hypothetical protein VJ835_06490 [Fimbriimonadaceae bacterium]|nr:hypothetical protein [Fimbriimonadaceae bacterium]